MASTDSDTHSLASTVTSLRLAYECLLADYEAVVSDRHSKLIENDRQPPITSDMHTSFDSNEMVADGEAVVLRERLGVAERALSDIKKERDSLRLEVDSLRKSKDKRQEEIKETVTKELEKKQLEFNSEIQKLIEDLGIQKEAKAQSDITIIDLEKSIAYEKEKNDEEFNKRTQEREDLEGIIYELKLKLSEINNKDEDPIINSNKGRKKPHSDPNLQANSKNPDPIDKENFDSEDIILVEHIDQSFKPISQSEDGDIHSDRYDSAAVNHVYPDLSLLRDQLSTVIRDLDAVKDKNNDLSRQLQISNNKVDDMSRINRLLKDELSDNRMQAAGKGRRISPTVDLRSSHVLAELSIENRISTMPSIQRYGRVVHRSPGRQ